MLWPLTMPVCQMLSYILLASLIYLQAPQTLQSLAGH